MSNPWRTLGVPRNADRRDVRRAYAAKLRQNHPDDDPEGFIRLREAYDAAITLLDRRDHEHARQQAEVGPCERLPGSGPDVAGDASQDAPPPPEPREQDCTDQQQIDAEVAAVEARMNALAHALAGDGPRDDASALAAFDALIAEPALDHIDIRGQVEHWLADLMAHNIPRSDAIMRQAIASFDWSDQADPRRQPPAVGALFARLEEWALIEAMARPGHPLHRAYRLLSERRPLWWSRIDALSSALRRQIAEVIDLADYQTPGLSHSLDADAVAWWRDRVNQASGGTGHVGVLLIGVLIATMFGILLQPGPAWVAIGVAGWAALVAVLMFGFAGPIEALGARVATSRRWIREGWVIAVIAWPVLILALPAQPWAVILAAASTPIALLWMLVARERRHSDETLNPISVLFVAGVFGMCGTAVSLTFDWAQQALLAIAALFTLAVRWLAIRDIGYLFHLRLVGVWKWLPMLVMLVLAAAMIGLAGHPSAPPPFVAISAVIACAMLIVSADFHGSGKQIGGGVALYWMKRIAFAVAFLTTALATVGPRAGTNPESAPHAAEALVAAYRGDAGEADEYARRARAALDGLQLHAPDLAAELAPLLADAARPLAPPSAMDALQQGLGRVFAARVTETPNVLVAEEFRMRIAIFRHLATIDPDMCAQGKLHYRYGDAPDLDRRLTLLTLAVLASPPATEADRAAGKPITERDVDEMRGNSPDIDDDSVAGRCRTRIREMTLLARFGTDSLASSLRSVPR